MRVLAFEDGLSHLVRDAQLHRSKAQVHNPNLKPSSDTADYFVARLERDGLVALLAQVRAGRLSPNAAAIEAGYRRAR